MSTKQIRGTVLDVTETPVPNASVSCDLSASFVIDATGEVISKEQTTITDSGGVFTFNVLANDAIAEPTGTSYVIRIRAGSDVSFSIVVPSRAYDPARPTYFDVVLDNLIVAIPPTPGQYVVGPVGPIGLTGPPGATDLSALTGMLPQAKVTGLEAALAAINAQLEILALWTTKRVNLLSAEDSSFEGGTVGGWTSGATLTNALDWSVIGTHSLMVTYTGGGYYQAFSGRVPTLGGSVYTALATVKASAGNPIILGIRWVDAGGGYLSDSFATPATTTGGNQQLTAQFTAPTNAAYASAVIYSPDGLASPLSLDCASIAAGSSTVWTPGY